MDAPLERQLTRALKVLQRQAGERGVIRGGSAVQTIKRAMRISLWHARELNRQLGLLGLRKTIKQGKHHTHTIVLGVVRVTKHDVARLRQLEAADARPQVNAECQLVANDPVGEVIEYIDKLEKENTLLRSRVDELSRKLHGDSADDPRFQELLTRIRKR